MRDLERDFPIVFGYEAYGKEDSVDSKVKYRVAGGTEQVYDDENSEHNTDTEAIPAA